MERRYFAPAPAASVRTTPRPARGVDAALALCTKGWLPVRGPFLRDLQERLGRGAFDDDADGLVTELRSDTGLLLYAVSRLGAAGYEPATASSPLSALRRAGAEGVSFLISGEEGEITSHALSDAHKGQTTRLRGATLSASVAEAVAERTGVDPELTYSCAVLRQLGLLLVSWNYPTVYSRALAASARGEGDLSGNLLRVLGFSPDYLGRRLVADWGLGPHVYLGLAGGGPAADERTARLRRACELGEAIARVTDPDHTPDVAGEWERVREEVEGVCGPGGVDVLLGRAETALAGYRSDGLRLFGVERSIEENIRRADVGYGDFLFGENASLARCPDDVKERFRKVYRHVRYGRPSPEAVRVLFDDVVPCLGFSGGCVYLHDERAGRLVPRLRIGAAPLSRYRTLVTTPGPDMAKPAVEALFAAAPIRRQGDVPRGEPGSHVTWSIGNGTRGGALYLELSEEGELAEGSRTMTYFRAVRQAVNDCLGLR